MESGNKQLKQRRGILRVLAAIPAAGLAILPSAH
jgi:hypothetical protein